MAGEKCIHTFIPKYFCTSGLVAQKLKGWNEPFVHSVGVRIFFRESCTPAERFVFRRNCSVAPKL